MDILAHRAIGFGPENSPAAVEKALELGFGVEIDLRISQTGEPYISHDALSDYKGRELARYLTSFAKYPDRTIAVNVKDLDAASRVFEILEQGSITKGFAFDFELLGISPPVQDSIAIRISDLPGERLDDIAWANVDYVWLDEMEREWVTKDVIREIGARSRCYWVSPELHGRTWAERWQILEPFDGLTGICTDHSLEFLQLYGAAADD